MESVIRKIEAKFKKNAVVDVKSGDTVEVHQKIKEGAKERIQIFKGLVIRTDRKGSHTSRITVRRTTGGIGVEKSFLLHSPLVVKVEVTKRSKVRRRLTGVDFDNTAVNTVEEAKPEVALEAPAAEAPEATDK